MRCYYNKCVLKGSTFQYYNGTETYMHYYSIDNLGCNFILYKKYTETILLHRLIDVFDAIVIATLKKTN